MDRILISLIIALTLNLAAVVINSSLPFDPFNLVIIFELIKLIPIFFFAENFKECIIIGLMVGIISSAGESYVGMLYDEPVWVAVASSIINSFLLAMGTYSIKSKNPVFYPIFPITIMVAIVIHWYSLLYGNVLLGLLSLAF